MRGLIFGMALLCAWTAASAVRGAPPAAPNTVEELVITPEAKCLPVRNARGARRPRIVSTFPASGAVVRPGRLVMRIAFDRPMTCSGFFMDLPPLPSPCPAARQKMVLSFNRRTVRLLCATQPNTAYGVRIGDWEANAFVSLDGERAEPYDLTFTTSSEPEVTTVGEALAQDR